MKLHTIGFAILSAVFIYTINISAWADTKLPNRNGPRPQTTSGVPHIQIGVSEHEALTKQFLQKVARIPGVDIRATVISLPGAKGFWLGNTLPVAQQEAIVRGREFAHIHPDGSLHASLPPTLAKQAIKAGWAISHPWSKKREGMDGFVMLYTPQTEDEMKIVFQLTLASYNYVTGQNVTID